MNDQKNQSISWSALEHDYYEKPGSWYTIMGIIALLIVAFSVWRQDWTMLFTFIIIFTAGAIYTHRRPNTIKITLSPKGISLGNKLYAYKNLKSFWIVYSPPEIKTLYIETSNYINQDMSIRLEDQNPNLIREYLMDYLAENMDKEENSTDVFLRRIKF